MKNLLNSNLSWRTLLTRDNLLILSIAIILILILSHAAINAKKERLEEMNKLNAKLLRQTDSLLNVQRQGVLDEIKAAEMRVKVIEREIHIIEQQEQKQKSDYEKDISVINNANASQQVIILSTNIAKYKDLDRQGYFNLPK
jgi:predicted DNA-binding protein YlxM (UPF0122 family)